MKNIALLFLLCLSCFGQSARAQSDKATRKALDKLVSNYTVPFAELKEQYAHTLYEGKPLTYPLERMTLQSGSEAVYQTSDNAKVKKALQKIFIASPVDFLLAIQGIEGRIAIDFNWVYWVKREDIPDLLKLATVDVVTPQISQGGKYLDFKLPAGVVPTYRKVPMGIAAMQMIDSYLFDVYPCDLGSIPSYQSIKTWADSGKPRSEYKFEIMFPIMGLRSVSYVPFKLYQYYPKKKAIDVPYTLTSAFINNCTHLPKQAAGYQFKLGTAIADVKVNNFVKNYSR